MFEESKIIFISIYKRFPSHSIGLTFYVRYVFVRGLLIGFLVDVKY